MLVALGHTITYDWTTHGPVFSRGLEVVRDVAVAEVQGVVTADAVVVLWPGGRGTHVELGIAIATPGKRVYFVSDVDGHHEACKETCAFYHHPRVTRLRTVEELYKELETPYKVQTGDWGHLLNEPCRYCFVVGRVFFESTDGWEGRLDVQRVRCDACGRMWDTTGARQ